MQGTLSAQRQWLLHVRNSVTFLSSPLEKVLVFLVKVWFATIEPPPTFWPAPRLLPCTGHLSGLCGPLATPKLASPLSYLCSHIHSRGLFLPVPTSHTPCPNSPQCLRPNLNTTHIRIICMTFLNIAFLGSHFPVSWAWDKVQESIFYCPKWFLSPTDRVHPLELQIQDFWISQANKLDIGTHTVKRPSVGVTYILLNKDIIKHQEKRTVSFLSLGWSYHPIHQCYLVEPWVWAQP